MKQSNCTFNVQRSRSISFRNEIYYFAPWVYFNFDYSLATQTMNIERRQTTCGKINKPCLFISITKRKPKLFLLRHRNIIERRHFLSSAWMSSRIRCGWNTEHSCLKLEQYWFICLRMPHFLLHVFSGGAWNIHEHIIGTCDKIVRLLSNICLGFHRTVCDACKSGNCSWKV